MIVNWDSRSGELNAFVGLLPRSGKAGDEYSLADVMGFAGVAVSDRKPAQVLECGRLGPFVESLAENLHRYGQAALKGDRMFFRSLEKFRSSESARFMREMNLRQLRSVAEKAWRDRQYGRVVDLYSSVESELSKAERLKLQYARQHRVG